jgi:hypothetical protein
MKKARLASTLALAFAGALGTVPTTAPATAPTVKEASQRGPEQAPAVAPAVSAFRIQRMMNDYTPLMTERSHGAIWQATAKRGSRRTRSRWNYNR